MLTIRNVKKADLAELTEIEQLCFTKEEAATREAFEERIKLIPDSFWVAEIDGVTAGLVNGPVIKTAYITDDLFTNIKGNPAFGGNQSILGLAVHPRFQNRGIASALLSKLEKEARAKNRETITLTCKENLISFYEKWGYSNQGVSSSAHGGTVWYNLVKRLN